LRPSNTVVFCAIDDLVPLSGNPLTGFPEFLDALAGRSIPAIWVTSRNRHQLDAAIRRLGHAEPFIAEGGSGVYLPLDYFHLKPERTVRLGRFTCIPIAAPQPAAEEGLELVAEEAGISVVPLRSLSARELMQNTGLSRQEAEAARQRDFDELFFFAGASEKDIQTFRQRAEHHGFAVRAVGGLWSLAVNANVRTAVQQLCKLYDRALHAHTFTVAVGTTTDAADLAKSCDRALLLRQRSSNKIPAASADRPAPKHLPLFSADTWILALEAIEKRQF